MAVSSKIVFFGSPPFAVRTLEAVLRSGREVVLIVTQPDRPAGRGRHLRASAVKEYGMGRLPLIQPVKMKDPKFHEQLRKTGAETFVVAAYGRILPRAVLDIPKFTLNVHASLLPRWRGAAPIERAIVNGDRSTGVSIMKLIEELDAGDVMLKKETEIGPEETAFDLENRLAEIGGKALVEALDLLDRGEAKFETQDVTLVTFAPPIQAAEAKVHWNKTQVEIHNQIRGFQPWPGAYTMDGETRIKLFASLLSNRSEPLDAPGSLKIIGQKLFVACCDGWLEILEVQREGKKRQTVAQFLSGYPIKKQIRWE